MAVIAIDLGGTKVAAALFESDGRILRRESALLEGRGGGEVGRLIADQIAAMMRAAGEAGVVVEAIGAAIPGLYDPNRRRVWAPNIPGWDDYALADEIGAAVGASVPVVVDSDRACAILGDTWQGTSKGCRNAIFVAVGTGIGAGILVDGRVLRGHGQTAGATGWMALERPFRAEYVSCGCFEHQASGPGLVKVAREVMERSPDYQGPLRDRGELSTADLFEAYEAGDPIAQKVFANAIELWGMAVANYVSLFDPEMIVFGGGVFGPAGRFLDQIRAEATRWGQPLRMPKLKLGVSSLGSDAVLVGAGALALRATPRAAPEFRRGPAFAAACMGMFIFGVTLLTLGALLPSLLERFQIDRAEGGSLLLLNSFAILLASIFFGPIADRFGYKNLLVLSCALVMVGLEGIAVAPSPEWLKAAILVFGFGGGLINGATNALVSDISESGRTAGLNVLGIFFGLGAVGVPFGLGMLVEHFAVPSLIAWLGLTILVPIAFMAAIRFPRAKQPQGFPIAKGFSLLGDGALVLMGLMLFLQSGMEISVGGWTAEYLKNELKLAEDRALLLSACYPLGMMLARWVMGTLLKNVAPAALLLGCIGIGLVGSAILVGIALPAAAALGVLLIGVGLAAGFPVVLGAVGGRYPRLTGTAFSVVLTMALIGGMILPKLTGVMGKEIGLRPAFGAIPAGLIVMAVLWGIVRRRTRKDGGGADAGAAVA